MAEDITQTATPIDINTPTLNTITSEPDCTDLKPDLLQFAAFPSHIDPKRRFLCPIEGCHKAYGKSSHLRSHLTWHSGEKPFICTQPLCMRGFTRSDELARHNRTHTGEKPYECAQCTKRFTRSDHLTKHLRVHLKHAKIDITPMLEVSLSEGPSCFVDPPVIDDISPMSTWVKQEITDSSICEKSQETRLEEQNETVYIKSEPEIKLEAETITTQPELYASSVITQILETEKSPSKFIKTEPISVEKRYTCPAIGCGKAFKRQDELKRHNRIHSGEKPFACNQCEKKFLRSDHLKKHIRTHSRSLTKVSS